MKKTLFSPIEYKIFYFLEAKKEHYLTDICLWYVCEQKSNLSSLGSEHERFITHVIKHFLCYFSD